MFRQVKQEADRVISGVDEAGGTVRRVAEDSREISDVFSGNAATLEEITVSIAHIAESTREADQLVSQTDSVSIQSASDIKQISSEMARTVDAVRACPAFWKRWTTVRSRFPASPTSSRILPTKPICWH
jgi:methyl-accepting chemotaxis protein